MDCTLTLEKVISTAMRIEAATEQAKAFCKLHVVTMQAVQPASWWREEKCDGETFEHC